LSAKRRTLATKPIQDLIFESRLTITYRTNITGTPKQESLPFRRLVLGNFSGELHHDAGLLPELEERKVRSIQRGDTVNNYRQISTANKQKVALMVINELTNIEAVFQFSIYDYDLIKKQYYLSLPEQRHRYERHRREAGRRPQCLGRGRRVDRGAVARELLLSNRGQAPAHGPGVPPGDGGRPELRQVLGPQGRLGR